MLISIDIMKRPSSIIELRRYIVQLHFELERELVGPISYDKNSLLVDTLELEHHLRQYDGEVSISRARAACKHATPSVDDDRSLDHLIYDGMLYRDNSWRIIGSIRP
jgi:hypothetical protein